MKQSMRKKIQSSMILVIALTLIIAYAITTLVVYRQTIHIMEGEVRQEADYINVAIDTSGESYLKIMDKVHKDTRITLIDSDGNVKYDSKEDEVTFQNHKNRPEVKEALKYAYDTPDSTNTVTKLAITGILTFFFILSIHLFYIFII